MRLIGSDPDIQTTVSRIGSGDIDLRPNFQRGEVWSRAKKQKLIDSILRDWHVPPIHVIEVPGSHRQEVLDGQQRLVAIRDFATNQFPVDGNIEPLAEEIRSLNGLYYRDLPSSWQRRFNQFTIRIFRVTDYKPAEPGELFFRLNQPTSLTGAEQRNAFFGPVREQIKALVALLQSFKAESYIGFKNSRMAYDDVIARVGLAIERKTLAEKITAANLADFYRRDQPLSALAVAYIEDALTLLASTFESPYRIRYNKATLFSWLMFIIRDTTEYSTLNSTRLQEFLRYFESLRHRTFNRQHAESPSRNELPLLDTWLFYVYEDRSSARVADVSSVLLRDAILWLFYRKLLLEEHSDLPKYPTLERMFEIFKDDVVRLDEDVSAKRLLDLGWGALPV